MEQRIVELRNVLRRYFQDNFSRVVTDRYFADIDFRPKYPGDLVKATNLHYLKYGETSQEIRYVDEIFTNAEVVVAKPNFETAPSSEAWIDRIVSYSIRVEFPDVNLMHDDIIQWERYQREGERTGRLIIADEDVVDNDVDPIPGMQRGIESGLNEVLPEHTGRSEESGIPLEFVENATPEDWEKLAEIRPLNL